MMRGRTCGNERAWGLVLGRGLGIQTFVRDDGGYTVVAMALALLLSITLAFGMAAAHWTMSRAADIQEVADAAAMAGANCVATYATIAQVLDACVLAMGLTGTVVCAAALVVAALPGLQDKAVPIMAAGQKVLQARHDFAHSAAAGMRRLEEALPYLVAANAASCVGANSRGGIVYVGMAAPVAPVGGSDYAHLEMGPDATQMQANAHELAEASARKDEAHKRALAAKERAWRADNVDDPLCMWSRASALTDLGASENPRYPSCVEWEFEYARLRARNYYARRLVTEAPAGGSVDECQRSAARARYYDYAYEALGSMPCIDTDDEVTIALEELPHNTSMVRETRLYTDMVWPCTLEDAGPTLHYSLACPGALGPYAGDNSLAAVDQGYVLECALCHMDAHAMGNVGNASSNISNGFEYYWRIVVSAARDYERARRDEIQAEQDMRRAAEKGRTSFEQAMDELSLARIKPSPPGRWGCVALVRRPSSSAVPSELTRAFLSQAELPAGEAVSAAALAPDNTVSDDAVFARALDRLCPHAGPASLDLVGSVTELWGKTLRAYGAVTPGAMEGVGTCYLEELEVSEEQRVGTWLRGELASLVKRAGLQPMDLSPRKPVIVNSKTVLGRGGGGDVRDACRAAYGASSSEGLASLMEGRARGQLGKSPCVIAELTVPGLEDATVPLALDFGWG